jgi:hypothetical protein
MKLKIKEKNGELIVDYYNIKDVHTLRCRALEYIFNMSDEGLFIFVDTNLGVKKALKSEIEKALDKAEAEYIITPTIKTERKFFGLSALFGRKKKSEKTESIIFAKIGKDSFSKDLYESFLRNYDYGIGIGCSIDVKELSKLYSDQFEELLFNKEILSRTIYDSILFSRIRADFIDRDFELFLRNSRQ